MFITTWLMFAAMVNVDPLAKSLKRFPDVKAAEANRRLAIHWSRLFPAPKPRSPQEAMHQKDAFLRQMAWSMLLEAQVQQSPIEDRTAALMGLRDTLDRFDQL